MKTAIFIDVQNIYYTTRDTFRRSFDYKRFWTHIESKDEKIKRLNLFLKAITTSKTKISKAEDLKKIYINNCR